MDMGLIMPDAKISDQPQPISSEERIQLNDSAQIESALNEMSPIESVWLIADLDKDDQYQLIEILRTQKSSKIIP